MTLENKPHSAQTIYLLPGRGGRLTEGLGRELCQRGYTVVGRELTGEFNRLSFGEQIELVATDLKMHFWGSEARVIANSFGAYLFLHAQTLLDPFPGRVLLLSPIVGEAAHEPSMTFFTPPRAAKLMSLAQSGNYPSPLCCEIHVGEHDWQAVPENVLKFGKLISVRTHLVEGSGHRLDRTYIDQILAEALI